MIWIFLNLIIVVLICLYTLFVVRKSRVVVEKPLGANLDRARDELSTKKKLLTDLAASASGLISSEEVESERSVLRELETKISSSKGKFAITEAEIDALDIRLRELEELRRELEVSKMDAIKKLEMLKAQQRDIANQNDAIREQLSSSLEQIEILLSMLNDNVDAVEQLNKARTEITNVEKQIAYYEEEINKINQQYVGLKRAYDALDIEYAQLYEKRQIELGE